MVTLSLLLSSSALSASASLSSSFQFYFIFWSVLYRFLLFKAFRMCVCGVCTKTRSEGKKPTTICFYSSCVWNELVSHSLSLSVDQNTAKKEILNVLFASYRTSSCVPMLYCTHGIYRNLPICMYIYSVRRVEVLYIYNKCLNAYEL